MFFLVALWCGHPLKYHVRNKKKFSIFLRPAQVTHLGLHWKRIWPQVRNAQNEKVNATRDNVNIQGIIPVN
jgi:hypothetical protein